MASNINPTLAPTKSLDNFRFWCQKVLPLVYDDSLSYYEVLGKMVVQLNDVIDNINADTENVLTLKDAFDELQEYVDNFFDDVEHLADYAERAEAAQTAANSSAINAASSAVNASISSQAAMDARAAAQTAAQDATASKNDAITAATTATTKAGEAAQSAINAQTAAATATTKAGEAAQSAINAQTAAATASEEADEASASASAAATSEQNARDLVDDIKEAFGDELFTLTADSTDIEQGGFNNQGLNTNTNFNYRLRTKKYYEVIPNIPIKITYTSNKEIEFACSFYSKGDFETPRYHGQLFRKSGAIIVAYTGAPFIRILFQNSPNSVAITPEDITNFKLEYLSIKEMEENGFIYSCNYISNDIKTKDVALTRLGLLAQAQSFCVYNNNYYSADEGIITKQDNAFNIIENYNMSIGHANTMQTGEKYKNYAYISGWNDNNLYIVDLDTMTIISTISLPTTGYTSCAVDDVNGILYILQRDSQPNTKAYYNWIVYDYINEQIMTQKIVPYQFGYLQGMDFSAGKIYVNCGAGNANIENHTFIFNTNGEILSEIHLETLSSQEPEGIVIDKDNNEIYYSISNKTLFKIK